MPKLSSSGQCLSGVAGVPASIDGVTIPIAGVQGDWCWYLPAIGIGQVKVQVSPDVYALQTSTGFGVSTSGAFFLAASGMGEYRTERSGDGKGRPIAGAEGYIAVIDDYQAGQGLTVYRDDNSVAFSAPSASVVGPPGRSCSIRDGLVAYWDGGWKIVDLGAANTPVPFTVPADVDWLVAAKDSAGATFLLQRSDARGLTLSPADGSTSQTIAPPSDHLFNPDMVRVGSKFRIAYSLTIGEEPQNVKVVDVTVGADQTLPPPDHTPPLTQADCQEVVTALESENANLTRNLGIANKRIASLVAENKKLEKDAEVGRRWQAAAAKFTPYVRKLVSKYLV